MVIEKRTDLSGAAVMEKAMVYFGGGLGMTVISETANAISFEGDEGTINVTTSEDGAESSVQVIAEGMEDRARAFLDGVADVGRESPDAPGM